MKGKADREAKANAPLILIKIGYIDEKITDEAGRSLYCKIRMLEFSVVAASGSTLRGKLPRQRRRLELHIESREKGKEKGKVPNKLKSKETERE